MKTQLTPAFNDLFFARAYYFSFMGGWGFILPFLNLFYISLGFSGTQIGLISSVSAVVGMIASPIWVSEVKKLPRAGRVLQIALLFGGLGYLAIGMQSIYAVILMIVFFHALIASGIMPLSDSMAVMVASESGNGYGSVRAFASLGWIVSLLSSGWLVARFGFIAAFIGVFLMWCIGALAVFFIQPRFFSAAPQTDQPKPRLRDTLQTVFRDRTLLGFAIAIVFIGFLNSGVLQFENVFLSELGASKQLISVAGILSAIVELPFMLYADKIVKRFGADRLMLIAMILIFLQRLVVFFLPSIATIMAIRFIGGVSFSFYTISFIGLISSRTQPHERGTVLALFTVTLAGLVNIVAYPASGAFFDAFGARWLYPLSALGYLIGALCLWWSRPK
jgi:PPP family 3-phenylpropionic acid transporter